MLTACHGDPVDIDTFNSCGSKNPDLKYHGVM